MFQNVRGISDFAEAKRKNIKPGEGKPSGREKNRVTKRKRVTNPDKTRLWVKEGGDIVYRREWA